MPNGTFVLAPFEGKPIVNTSLRSESSPSSRARAVFRQRARAIVARRSRGALLDRLVAMALLGMPAHASVAIATGAGDASDSRSRRTRTRRPSTYDGPVTPFWRTGSTGGDEATLTTDRWDLDGTVATPVVLMRTLTTTATPDIHGGLVVRTARRTLRPFTGTAGNGDDDHDCGRGPQDVPVVRFPVAPSSMSVLHCRSAMAFADDAITVYSDRSRTSSRTW